MRSAPGEIPEFYQSNEVNNYIEYPKAEIFRNYKIYTYPNTN